MEGVSLKRLWALMLTVFVDMVGFLMVLPLLPFYAQRLGSDAQTVGLLVSAYAVAQLATAPTWGRLSDRFGRRPVIMAGLVCSGIAFFVFARSHAVWMLFLTRFVQGAGGGTIGVVQAYVGDSVTPEERAKALGWITAATSAGVMIGPAIGSLAASLGPAAPGYAAAALCVLNFASAWRWLPETNLAGASAARVARPPLRHAMMQVFRDPRRPVARLIWIYAIGMMAFMAMNGVLALFLQYRYGVTEATIGYFYTYVGTISLVMRSLVLGPTVKRFGEIRVLRLGLLAMTIGYALLPFCTNVPEFAVVVLAMPIGTALLFPATTSLVSRFAEKGELGATMGVQQAYGGIARLAGPTWAGFAFQHLGPGAPFWLCSAVVAVTSVYAVGLSPPPDAARDLPAEEPA